MGREPLPAAALVAGMTLLAGSLVGCKSKPEKICANLAELIAKESPDKKVTAEDQARCLTDIKLELDRCENAETITSCYVEAKTLDAIATCESKCQKKPKASTSASPRREPGEPTPSPREPGEPTPSPREPGEPTVD